MIAPVTLDTGPLLSTFNAKDRAHARCVDFSTRFRGRRTLPGPVFAEVSWSLERWQLSEAAFVEQVAENTFELA